MKPNFKEDFLHYLWQYQILSPSSLRTKSGQCIEILNRGLYNENSGPDFLHAELKIGDTYWVGHVEIHVSSSDWFKHQHQFDPAYENVILHFVYEDDQPVNGIPVLEMKNQISEKHLIHFKTKKVDVRKRPCDQLFNGIPEKIIQDWKYNNFLELIEEKETDFQLHFYNLEKRQALYLHLGRLFGLYVNQEAFHKLTQWVSMKWVHRLKYQPELVEALYFGQAGFFNNDQMSDYYYTKLRSHYLHLKNKYNLYSMSEKEWKFSRMRPHSFPTVRISQWVNFITYVNFDDFFDSIENFDQFKSLFSNVYANEYWMNHSHFGRKCKSRNTNLGDSFIHRLYLNTLPAILFLKNDGKINADKLKKALNSLSSENNNVVRSFKKSGLKFKSAYDSQSVLKCYKNKCKYKKCNCCSVGKYILSPGINQVNEGEVRYLTAPSKSVA